MTQDDLGHVSSTHVIVGLSSIVKLIPASYERFQFLKIASGGSLEIVPAGSSGSGWNTGYLLGATEIYNLGNNPSTIYLAATGSTVTASLSMGYTFGASFL